MAAMHSLLLTGCILMATLPSFNVQATETPLRIATINLSPAGYKEDGLSKGLFYEIANAVAKEAGLSYKNTVKPYGRVLNDLKSGKTDMSMLGFNPILEGKASHTTPILELRFMLVSQKGLNIQTIEGFSGKTIGVIRALSR